MPTTIEQITTDALTLSEPARAQLAHALLRSLDAPAEEQGVESAWEVEVARRMERLRQGTATGRPAEEVFRDIRARYRR